MLVPHDDYMQLALRSAERGRFSVSPNPMVGCCIVKNDQVIGTGYHHHAGGPHAEIIALAEANSAARDATIYLTLEPCCHFGRTPPCTDALINAGVSTVIVACEDPNPLVAGKGIAQLRAAGIDVIVGVCAAEARKVNEIFFHYMQHQRPFVIAKWAMSLDGKTCTHPHDTRKISGTAAHDHAHQTRQQVDAIIIGANTARLDDPLLTARPEHNVYQQPLRIIISKSGDLSPDLQLFKTAHAYKTCLVSSDKLSASLKLTLEHMQVDVITLPTEENNQLNLTALMQTLGQRGITSVLVEGGMQLIENFFNANLVNKIQVYVTPVIIGGHVIKKSLSNVEIKTIDSDILLTANDEDK